MKIYFNNILKNVKRNKKEKSHRLEETSKLETENNEVLKKSNLKEGEINKYNEKIIYSLKKFNLKKRNTAKLKIYDSKIQNNEVYNVIKMDTLGKKSVRSGAIKVLSNNKDKTLETKKLFNKHNLPKSYYALLLFMILLAGVSGKLVFNKYVRMEQEDYAVFSSVDDASVENYEEISNQNNESSNLDTRISIEKEGANSSVSTSNSSIDKVQDTVEKILVTPKEEYLIFIKPINGEISKIFSEDKVIYSKTLEMWKTHEGIDILAKIGDSVCSIERGTIEKVYEDAFYGITIVINHGQGYKSSYSNLSKETLVKEGETIKKGKVIGKIGNTAIGEIKDMPHLHFMLYKNNKIADPTSIFE